MNPQLQKIYNAAKGGLGEHLTLNHLVPAEVGCCEAVSKVLSLAGFPVPAEGIPNTLSLYTWLKSNPNFTEIGEPEPGAILVSTANPTGSGIVSGHTGVFGQLGAEYTGDFGIMSNNSDSGVFLELWSWKNWQKYFIEYGKLETGIFLAVGIN